jgi:hypothetical protein
MVIERRWEKRCNICNRLLAVKNYLFFQTVFPYVPIGLEFNGLVGNETHDMHICQECWIKMKDKIRIEVAEDGK